MPHSTSVDAPEHRAVTVVTEVEAPPVGGVQIAGVLEHGQLPPAGTPAGTIFLVKPAN